MPSKWRLVDSGFVSPAESAALDEAILEAHIAGLVPDTLHFYVRSVPTVSVGYFQKVSESLDIGACERLGVAVVRRKSGGSSVYTDSGQLIYGLVVGEDEVPKDRAESFQMVCSALARAISSLGVDAKYRPMNDVEIGGRKVSGNAQLRRKGSVLQHGTIIVDTDVAAMDSVLRVNRAKDPSAVKPSDRITTLAVVLGSAPPLALVKSCLVGEIEGTFGSKLELGALTDREHELVRKLVAERYGDKAWNLKF